MSETLPAYAETLTSEIIEGMRENAMMSCSTNDTLRAYVVELAKECVAQKKTLASYRQLESEGRLLVLQPPLTSSDMDALADIGRILRNLDEMGTLLSTKMDDLMHIHPIKPRELTGMIPLEELKAMQGQLVYISVPANPSLDPEGWGCWAELEKVTPSEISFKFPGETFLSGNYGIGWGAYRNQVHCEEDCL